MPQAKVVNSEKSINRLKLAMYAIKNGFFISLSHSFYPLSLYFLISMAYDGLIMNFLLLS
jgi:hypothetical protein